MTAPDPTRYESRLPVHQDGSCNGLQHYAALGRDTLGAKQVNLLPSDEPQDVYAGVMRLVAEKVALDAAATDETDDEKELLHRELARKLDGHIKRKIVKQSVMTSVYGVTFIGAKQQIQNRLEEVPELKELPEKELSRMAIYLARLTLDSLGQVRPTSVTGRNVT